MFQTLISINALFLLISNVILCLRINKCEFSFSLGHRHQISPIFVRSLCKCIPKYNLCCTILSSKSKGNTRDGKCLVFCRSIHYRLSLHSAITGCVKMKFNSKSTQNTNDNKSFYQVKKIWYLLKTRKHQTATPLLRNQYKTRSYIIHLAYMYN